MQKVYVDDLTFAVDFEVEILASVNPFKFHFLGHRHIGT